MFKSLYLFFSKYLDWVISGVLIIMGTTGKAFKAILSLIKGFFEIISLLLIVIVKLTEILKGKNNIKILDLYSDDIVSENENYVLIKIEFFNKQNKTKLTYLQIFKNICYDSIKNSKLLRIKDKQYLYTIRKIKKTKNSHGKRLYKIRCSFKCDNLQEMLFHMDRIKRFEKIKPSSFKTKKEQNKVNWIGSKK